MNAIKNFIADEAGITAIEYALLAAGIAVVVGTAAATLGTKIVSVFTGVTNKLVAPT
ncbi:Flp family type IVb pilin [Duganella sp. FT134W]|uniref:Flp family type IVb pilin n=1 Tax=Duganella margarita TaxID=2692170 RepID=A0A7X4H4B5_9BURK|nr:Flp family type IVb pilin [Duganella margarita]MYM75078.1 Flp family type IVb pilin [Duganella margarita]